LGNITLPPICMSIYLRVSGFLSKMNDDIRLKFDIQEKKYKIAKLTLC
jgi:hypothetical protein